MEGRLADADDRRVGDAARSVEPGVVEAGNDVGIAVGCLLHLADHARNREDLVEIAFDARRTVAGIDRDDLGARRRRPARRFADLGGHRSGRVRIDDKYAHCECALDLAAEIEMLDPVVTQQLRRIAG